MLVGQQILHIIGSTSLISQLMRTTSVSLIDYLVLTYEEAKTKGVFCPTNIGGFKSSPLLSTLARQ